MVNNLGRFDYEYKTQDVVPQLQKRFALADTGGPQVMVALPHKMEQEFAVAEPPLGILPGTLGNPPPPKKIPMTLEIFV